MQKVLEISGRQITFESNGATPIIFKKITGKDFFASIFKMNSMSDILSGKSKKINTDKMENLDFDVFYEIIYCLARCADKNIPPFEEFFASFDSFGVIEVMGELNELLLSSIQSKKK